MGPPDARNGHVGKWGESTPSRQRGGSGLGLSLTHCLLWPLGLEDVQHLPSSPGSFPRDPLPCVRGHSHPLARLRLAGNKQSSRSARPRECGRPRKMDTARPKAVQFHADPEMIGVHEIIRVAKAGRIDYPDGGGILPAPIRQPLGGGQNLSAHSCPTMTNAIRLPATNRSLLHAPFQQRQEPIDSCEKQSKHIAVRSTRRSTPPIGPRLASWIWPKDADRNRRCCRVMLLSWA
uniref:Uncharacterized protein n=1 Tax=Candidatus Kentrum sp. SD TaxID=2126332 RepID=A0A451BPV9_9GAMM|nr:MAG: hypothetical protein BECKSD772D_GA0070982_110212 [Candidatus Kentron sp. SD]